MRSLKGMITVQKGKTREGRTNETITKTREQVAGTGGWTLKFSLKLWPELGGS